MGVAGRSGQVERKQAAAHSRSRRRGVGDDRFRADARARASLASQKGSNVKKIAMALIAALLGSFAAPAPAQGEVKTPWVRATVPGQKTSSAYLVLKSAEEVTFVGAESPVAAVVDLHEMRMDGNVMRMRAVPRLVLPRGKVLQLNPGGFHLMLTGRKQPLRKGDSVPITLRFEGRDNAQKVVEIRAEVRDSGAAAKQH